MRLFARIAHHLFERPRIGCHPVETKTFEQVYADTRQWPQAAHVLGCENSGSRNTSALSADAEAVRIEVRSGARAFQSADHAKVRLESVEKCKKNHTGTMVLRRGGRRKMWRDKSTVSTRPVAHDRPPAPASKAASASDDPREGWRRRCRAEHHCGRIPLPRTRIVVS